MNTKRKVWFGLTLAVLFAMLVSTMAFADTVQNDVTAALGNDTFALGGSTTVNYRIMANSGDGQTGCNAADTTPATVTINVPDGVTATPEKLTFTSCSTYKPVVFTSTVTVDSLDVTVSVSDAGTGEYNTNPAKFTLHVTAPTNTAPSLEITGVTGGFSYEIGSVPAATCNVTDAEDGNSSFAATLSEITGSLAAYGLGEQTASCSYTDAGGLTASASVTYNIVDTKVPVITFSSRTLANGNGWNNSAVTVTWSCTDSGSGVVEASISKTVSTEGAEQLATGTCTDHAGNTASDTQTGISIDMTKPTASASASPEANANGWNNTDVTVTFTGEDSLSKIDFCSDPVVLSSDGANQSASGTCTDKADNISDEAFVTV